MDGTSAYKTHYPRHNQYWQEIAAEVQCFGGNTIATVFRGGKGVLYREVFIDVCNKLKVNFNKNSNISVIKSNLLMKIVTDALESMSPDDIRALGGELGIKNATGLTWQAP
ncbi:hypothetical protein PWM41_001000 [Providencia rettgeri]|nr:hypothetical protein [Providencia rettgeri]